MIATGYLPYTFSENLCNAKLVYALQEAGVDVDVISRADEGLSYHKEWEKQWLPLKPNSYEVIYSVGNKLSRFLDYTYSGYKMHYRGYGVRWARRAYQKALSLIKENHYDAVLTRSPSSISHLVGMRLKKRTGIKWVANWNDPIDALWPEPLTSRMSEHEKKREIAFTNILLNSADIISFPADSLRQYFIKYFPSLKYKQTEVIPHIGLSEQLFFRKTHQNGQVLRLCHSGNLVDVRDPELLFRAMRELIDKGIDCFHLDIMGRTDDDKKRALEHYCLQKYVNIGYGYPYFEAIDHLQDYDALVLLEGMYDNGIFFASKITDYVQTGKPIFAISPKTGFAASLIAEHGGGIAVDNRDYDEIKNGLIKLIELWKHQQLERLSSTNIYSLFSPQKVISQYLSIIN